jgi:CPA2 family monovalent cation:H+ antiporter-2
MRHPLEVLEVLAIIVLGKSLAAFFIVRLLGRPASTALTVSAALAQIGEFSFILAVMGVALKILPPEGQSYIVAGALLSIVANPLVFALVGRLRAHDRTRRTQRPGAPGNGP